MFWLWLLLREAGGDPAPPPCELLYTNQSYGLSASSKWAVQNVRPANTPMESLTE